MRNFLKNVVAIAVYLSGVAFLVRAWRGRGRVAILLYHDPTPAVFAEHIAYLARRYTFISLDTLVAAIRRNDFSELPPKSVVVTIDDGHAGNFALLPIFKRYALRPTLYVCTQLINTHRHFWFKIEGLSKAEKERLKRVANAARLAHLKQTADFEPEKAYPHRQALNRAEIREMTASVDFQPHTRFHPILPRCTETVCREEVCGSKADLETLLERECSHFSYPNGDYTGREIQLVKRAGFASARTTDIGWNTQATSPYRLKVLPISDDAGAVLFRAELAAIPQRLSRRVNALFSGDTP